jgi:hypothetical protein
MGLLSQHFSLPLQRAKRLLDGQITDAQKEGDVRVGSSRRRKMSKEKICGGSL